MLWRTRKARKARLLRGVDGHSLWPKHLSWKFGSSSSYVIHRDDHWRLSTIENGKFEKINDQSPAFLLELDSTTTPIKTSTIRRQLDRVRELDDVTEPCFLEHIIIAVRGIDIEQEVVDDLHDAGIKEITLACAERNILLESGPCVVHHDNIWNVAKLYDDANGTFMAAVRPMNSEKRFVNLGLCGSQYQTLSVAVPSRATAILGKGPKLKGIRLAVKDMFAVAGLKNSLCSRPYYAIAKTATQTAPCVSKLLDEGCDLVGMLKLSSFIGREEPTEAIDYQVPFNPRGDGYQSPAGSSSGSAASIASYEWLDVTLGSDTTGSGRRPALVNGCFTLRLSQNLLPREGMVPTFDLFDTQCLFTRDIDQLYRVLDVCLGSSHSRQSNQDEPRRLLYPVDFFPVDNDIQMQHVKAFSEDLSSKLQAPLEEIDLAAEWMRSGPGKDTKESLKSYLEDVATETFLYDFYHSYDEFRESYRAQFGKEPYVNEYTRWRWDTAKTVTKEQNRIAVQKILVYREWLLDKIFEYETHNTYMILPIAQVSPNYRDRRTEPPSKQYAYDSLYISPTMRGAELVIPIAEFPYQSRVSGKEEKLPIAVSVVGKPGVDLVLIQDIITCLEKSNRPKSVSPGAVMFLN